MLTVLCYSPVVAAVSVTWPSKVTTQISCTQLLHRHIVTLRRCLDVNNSGRICDLTLRLPGIWQKSVVLSQFVEVRVSSYFSTCLCFSRNDRIISDDSADAMIVTEPFGGKRISQHHKDGHVSFTICCSVINYYRLS